MEFWTKNLFAPTMACLPRGVACRTTAAIALIVAFSGANPNLVAAQATDGQAAEATQKITLEAWRAEEKALLELIDATRTTLAAQEANDSGAEWDRAATELIEELFAYQMANTLEGDWPERHFAMVVALARSHRREARGDRGDGDNARKEALLNGVALALREVMPARPLDPELVKWLAGQGELDTHFTAAANAVRDSGQEITDAELDVALAALKERFYNASRQAPQGENGADQHYTLMQQVAGDLERAERRNRDSAILGVEGELMAALSDILDKKAGKGVNVEANGDQETVWQYRGPRNNRSTKARRKGEEPLL